MKLDGGQIHGVAAAMSNNHYYIFNVNIYTNQVFFHPIFRKLAGNRISSSLPRNADIVLKIQINLKFKD
jgi:leucyl aminopeptidase (aminopeptidase T)